MTDIKPCPFCGQQPGVDENGYIVCVYRFCQSSQTLSLAAWNRRPIEDALAVRIAELEAELAAVPKWTRITEDPATWPSERSLIVMADRPRLPQRGWRLTVERVNVPEPLFSPSWEYAWFPITPPTEAADA